MVLDPISALGVAAAVVQFVDFGFELTSKSRELAKSSTGSLIDHRDLIDAANRLEILDDRLQKSSAIVQQQKLSREEEALLEVSGKCRKTAGELRKTLESIAAKPGEGTFKSFRQAFKAVWHKDSIENMRSRINDLQQQLCIHLLVVMR